jgi:hypothetical protein
MDTRPNSKLCKALELKPNYPAAPAYLDCAHQIRFMHGGQFVEVEKIGGLNHARASIAKSCGRSDRARGRRHGDWTVGQGRLTPLDAIERALSC